MSVTRHEEGCYFCGSTENIRTFSVVVEENGVLLIRYKWLCRQCLQFNLLSCSECSTYDSRCDPHGGWVNDTSYNVCPICVERHTKTCPQCGCVHYSGYYALCADCRRHTVKCARCNRSHYNNDNIHTDWHVVNGVNICPECYSNLPSCNNCREIYYGGYNVFNRRGVSSRVCPECFNNTDIVMYCDDCGNAYWADSLDYSEENDEYYCPICMRNREDTSRNNSVFCAYHSHKRNNPIYHGKAGLPKFGFELEMNGSRDMFIEISDIDGYSEHFYIEEDGSIDDGYEIISQPATLEYWNNSKELESVFRIINDYDGYADSSTGLHIHYSKSTLDKNKQGETKLHEHKILLFVCKHQDMSGCVARRYADDSAVRNYSPYENIHRMRNGATYSSEVHWVYRRACDNRYICVNLTNKYTIEFRIYKSTTDISELYAALEYTDAVVEYTRSKTMGEILADTKNDDFVSFIQRRDNRQKYEHLIDILTSESIIPKQPKRKPVTLKTSKKRSNKVCA